MPRPFKPTPADPTGSARPQSPIAAILTGASLIVFGIIGCALWVAISAPA